MAICPRIRKQSQCIIATTAWRIRILLVGLVYRRVVIDPGSRTVTEFSRYGWLFRSTRTTPFSKVRAVTYGYEDLSTDQILAYAHDSFDWFTVGLRLADDSEIRLFSFIGEGRFGNDGPFPDWFYWPDFRSDLSGSQERESRVFVDVLSKLLNVPEVVSKPNLPGVARASTFTKLRRLQVRGFPLVQPRPPGMGYETTSGHSAAKLTIDDDTGYQRPT